MNMKGSTELGKKDFKDRFLNGWKNFNRYLFGGTGEGSKNKHFWLSVTCGVLLIFALIAMFADFTFLHKEGGQMLFGDSGSSMWMRLAVALPCLTFVVGTFSVACFRFHNMQKVGYAEKDYKKWEKEGDWSKNGAKKLLGLFVWGMFILMFVTLIFGGISNAGDGLLWVAVGTLAAASAGGIYFINYHKFDGQKK